MVARVSRDSLRVGRLLGQYAIDDVLLGAARPASNVFTLRLSQGLPFLGGTDDHNPLPGRTGEQVGFTAFSFDASRSQFLFAPWNGASLSLKGRLLGQATSDVLPPSEQFFLGGNRISPRVLRGRGHRRQRAGGKCRARPRHRDNAICAEAAD